MLITSCCTLICFTCLELSKNCSFCVIRRYNTRHSFTPYSSFSKSLSWALSSCCSSTFKSISNSIWTSNHQVRSCITIRFRVSFKCDRIRSTCSKSCRDHELNRLIRIVYTCLYWANASNTLHWSCQSSTNRINSTPCF